MWSPRAWENDPFWPIQPAARAFLGHRDWPTVEEYDAVLGPLAGVRFVEQGPRPRRRRAPGPSYDARICEEGVVPSRPRSWHDFFNALVWAAYPRTKRALHARQYRARVEGGRTREGDALALLDEGGVVLLCAHHELHALGRALAARDDDHVMDAIARGVAVAAAYGHALFEHLARSAPPVRAVVHLAVAADTEHRAAADEALACALTAGAFTDPTLLGSVPATAALLRSPHGSPAT